MTPEERLAKEAAWRLGAPLCMRCLGPLDQYTMRAACSADCGVIGTVCRACVLVLLGRTHLSKFEWQRAPVLKVVACCNCGRVMP